MAAGDLPLDDAHGNSLAHVADGETTEWGVVSESLNALDNGLVLSRAFATRCAAYHGLAGNLAIVNLTFSKVSREGNLPSSR